MVQAITRGGPRWPDTLYEPPTQPRARGASSKKAEAAAGRRSSSSFKKIGGDLEAFYFAFGEDDVYVIADLPDNVTAAAVGLAVSGSVSSRTRTVVLLTPEEIDEATKKSVEYRAPGE